MPKKLLGALLACALAFALPAPSHAETSQPDVVKADFNGGAGGWTSRTESEGLCIPQLLCPAVSAGYARGGADGNGYLKTTFDSLAATLAGTSSSIWQSPSFTYRGLDGKVPGRVEFNMLVLQNLGALLNLSVLNTSSYQVDLVDQTNGNAIRVADVPVVPSAGWTAARTASVSPALLTLGRDYRIRIKTRYTAVATVIASGEVGFDNVRLTAVPADGGGGKGITINRKELRHLTKTYILPGSAKIVGKHLRLKLRCPAKAAPLPCKIQAQGLRAGKFSKPATARKFVSLKAGKKKWAKIRIKPAYRTSYRAAAQAGRKIWVKATVRVGKIRVTVRKRMKLR